MERPFKYVTREEAVLLACDLASKPALSLSEATTRIIIDHEALRRVAMTKYSATQHHPGRSGYPREVREAAIEQWCTTAITATTAARNFDVDYSTMKRWLKDAGAVKRPSIHNPTGESK